MGPKFEKMSKNYRIYDFKIPVNAENYEEYDGTIAGSPNLQKVVVFDEILLEKKKVVVRTWIRRYRFLGQKSFKKHQKLKKTATA